MKSAIKVTFKLMVFYWKRSVSFICLIALLATTAGLLGNIFLSDEVSFSKVSLAIVNNDNSEYTDMFVREVLKEAENSQVISALEVSKAKGYSLLDEGQITALLILPKGFLNSVFTGENLGVNIVYNPNYPVQSLIIQTAADELLGLLEASQTGIYTTLGYIEEHAPESYSNAYLRINTRYIKNVMAFKTVAEIKTISPVGEVSFFAHYLSAALFTLIMLGACLYIPIIKVNFTPAKTRRIFGLTNKVSSFMLSINIGWWLNQLLVVLVLFTLYAGTAAVIGLEFSFAMVAALVPIICFTTSFGVFIAFTLKTAIGNLVIIAYSLLNLFFSGGILPMVFFSDSIRGMAKFFPSYYGVQLLKNSMAGKLDLFNVAVLMLFSFLLFAATSFIIKRKEVA